MSLFPNGIFGRRSFKSPNHHQTWNHNNPSLVMNHGIGNIDGTMTRHVALHEEPSPIVNTHIEWKETPEAHVCKAHLPGMKRSDVRVEVDDERVLCIVCEKKVEMQEHRQGWHRVEVSSGHFVQRLTLPENAMVNHVKAYMDNGVLTIRVPKHRSVNNHVRNVQISHV